MPERLTENPLQELFSERERAKQELTATYEDLTSNRVGSYAKVKAYIDASNNLILVQEKIINLMAGEDKDIFEGQGDFVPKKPEVPATPATPGHGDEEKKARETFEKLKKEEPPMAGFDEDTRRHRVSADEPPTPETPPPSKEGGKAEEKEKEKYEDLTFLGEHQTLVEDILSHPEKYPEIDIKQVTHAVNDVKIRKDLLESAKTDNAKKKGKDAYQAALDALINKLPKNSSPAPRQRAFRPESESAKETATPEPKVPETPVSAKNPEIIEIRGKKYIVEGSVWKVIPRLIDNWLRNTRVGKYIIEQNRADRLKEEARKNGGNSNPNSNLDDTQPINNPKQPRRPVITPIEYYEDGTLKGGLDLSMVPDLPGHPNPYYQPPENAISQKKSRLKRLINRVSRK